MSYKENRPIRKTGFVRRLPRQDPVKQVGIKFVVPADKQVRVRVYGRRGDGIHVPRYEYDVGRRYRESDVYEELVRGDQRGPNSRTLPPAIETTQWRIRFRQKNSVDRGGRNVSRFVGEEMASLGYRFRGDRFIIIECTW